MCAYVKNNENVFIVSSVICGLFSWPVYTQGSAAIANKISGVKCVSRLSVQVARQVEC